jgi:hypothetical protein
MKSTRLALLSALAVAAILSISQLASAQLTIDDFSTGAYSKTLKTGSDTHTETGAMLGDSRYTLFVSCPSSHCGGGGKGLNPFDQPSSFQVKLASKSAPSVLILNSGYMTYPFLDLGYGYGSPMSVDLSSSYDRIRLNFYGSNQSINTNIEVSSSSGMSGLGCNIIPPEFMQPFSVDFPFADFSGSADYGAVTNIFLEFGVSEGLNAEMDFGLTSIQAIPTGAPKGNVTCN